MTAVLAGLGGWGAAVFAETGGVVVAAVSRVVVGVVAGAGTAVYGAQGAAAVVAEARLVGVAAVGHAVVGVASGFGAALHGAEGGAGVVAVAAPVGIAAVGHAVVGVASGCGAAFHGAHGYGSGDSGSARGRIINRGGAAVVAAAMSVVSGRGQDQKGHDQDTEQGRAQALDALHDS